jgi:hypothetical protein
VKAKLDDPGARRNTLKFIVHRHSRRRPWRSSRRRLQFLHR